MMNTKIGHSMHDRARIIYRHFLEDLAYTYDVPERIENWGTNVLSSALM